MAQSERPVVVVTGGYGRVARMLAPRLREQYRVRVVDRVRGDEATAADEEVLGDLLEPAVRELAFHGADAVLHLAGDPRPDAPWSAALDNIDLTRGVLRAAQSAGVEHCVVASSVHAAGGAYHFGPTPVSPYGVPRPCCEYGVGKVACEALARLHYDLTGASVRVLRFGLTAIHPDNQELAKTWLGDRDAASLVLGALASSPGFGIYFGVSRYSARFWDTSNAAADLGWEPTEELSTAVDSHSTQTNMSCSMFAPPPGERQSHS